LEIDPISRERKGTKKNDNLLEYLKPRTVKRVIFPVLGRQLQLLVIQILRQQPPRPVQAEYVFVHLRREDFVQHFLLWVFFALLSFFSKKRVTSNIP